MKTKEQVSIAEGLPDGVLRLVNGQIQWANPAFWGLLEVAEDSIPTAADLSHYVLVSNHEALQEALVEAGTQSTILETSLQAGSSKPISVEIHFAQSGDSILAVVRNITARHEQEERFEENKQRAAHMERLRALGEMAAGVAHDFNNTLTTILGRLNSIRKKLQEKEPIEGELVIIEAAAQSATDLVMRIREFSRPTHQGQAWQDVDLRLLLEQAYLFVETRIPKTVSLEKDLQAVPVIWGNKNELLEVFLNLLTNALDAVETNGTVQLSCHQEGTSVVVKVRDDGVGIPEKTQQRIFEPFFSTKEDQGTGLGLSISQWILRRHDAQIQLKSTQGEGTEFSIIFSSESLHGPQRQLTKSKLSVVVVDDDENVAEMVKDLLEDEGHNVELITDYERMVHFSCEMHPDLVITDLDLAGTSGWDLVRSVGLLYPETVIGLMTGWPLDSSEEELRVRGIDFILNKPFSLNALHRALEKVGYQKDDSN